MEIGERYGRWTVVGPPVNHISGRLAVPCRCDCGTERVVMAQSLRRKDRANPSCGCWKAERTRTIVAETRWKDSHGLSKHPLYRTWRGMMRRCYDLTDYHYPRWGGRGISVYADWHDVRVFIEWVEPNLGLRPGFRSIDRIDNDGDYEPGNVRWATAREQHENSRCRHDPITGRWIEAQSYDGG